MSETHAPSPLEIEQHPERHESTDVQARPIVWFIIIFFVFAVLVHLLVWWTFAMDLRAPEQAGNIHEVVPNVARDKTFQINTPEPRLQGMPGGPGLRGGRPVPDYHKNTPRQDTQEMKDQTQAILKTSGDSYEQGFKRIPIEDAIRLAAQRHLIQPKLPSATHPTTLPTTQPNGGAGVHR
jgi:hypothetical protein